MHHTRHSSYAGVVQKKSTIPGSTHGCTERAKQSISSPQWSTYQIALIMNCLVHITGRLCLIISSSSVMSLTITWPKYLTSATSPMTVSLTANEGLGMCIVALRPITGNSAQRAMRCCAAGLETAEISTTASLNRGAGYFKKRELVHRSSENRCKSQGAAKSRTITRTLLTPNRNTFAYQVLCFHFREIKNK